MKQITCKRRLLLRKSQHGRTYLHGLGQVLAHRGMPTGFGVIRRGGIRVEDNGQPAVRRRRAHLTGSCGAVSSICHPEEVAGSVATGIDSELGLGAIVRRTIIHSEIGKVHLDDMSRGGRKERGSLVALLGIVVAAICGGNGVGELPVAQHLDSLATAFGIGSVLDSQCALGIFKVGVGRAVCERYGGDVHHHLFARLCRAGKVYEQAESIISLAEREAFRRSDGEGIISNRRFAYLLVAIEQRGFGYPRVGSIGGEGERGGHERRLRMLRLERESKCFDGCAACRGG